MNTNDVIEATARKLSKTAGGEPETWLPHVLTLAEDGLLADDLPAQPIPIGTRKRNPKTGDEVILTDMTDFMPWMRYRGPGGGSRRWLGDNQVAEWEIITDDTSRPALPEGHVALDLRECDDEDLKAWLQMRVNLKAAAQVLEPAARAELARRSAEGHKEVGA